MTIVHHPRAQVVTEQHNVAPFIDFQNRGLAELKRAKPDDTEQSGN
jgi:hypothetical protein